MMTSSFTGKPRRENFEFLQCKSTDFLKKIVILTSKSPKISASGGHGNPSGTSKRNRYLYINPLSFPLLYATVLIKGLPTQTWVPMFFSWKQAWGNSTIWIGARCRTTHHSHNTVANITVCKGARSRLVRHSDLSSSEIFERQLRWLRDALEKVA